jgi:hypothetical protein
VPSSALRRRNCAAASGVFRNGAHGHARKWDASDAQTEAQTMLGTILLVILILLLLGAVPAWPYSRGWGYYPSGGIGLILLIVIIVLLLGRA